MLKHLTITITGAPREDKSIEILENRVLLKIGKMADEPKCESYNFAQIHYRLIFTAMNFDITKIDTLHKQILRLTESYLEKWQYTINIKYTETDKD